MKRVGKKIICSILVCLTLTGTGFAKVVDYGVELSPNEKTYEQSFSDVAPDHWAFTYIEDLVDRGAINGYPDGKFYPNKTVTREEFAKIMVVAAGLKATPASASSYADVPLTYWASPFIETAKPYMTAYQSGGNVYFKPTDGALREDMAVAVVMLKGYDTRLADLSMIRTMFTDVEAISSGAQTYVALAVENGIISGYSDGTFRGQATITRCEAAAILWRAFQYGSDQKLMPGETPASTPTPSIAPAETAEPTPSAAPEATPEPSEEPEQEIKPYQIDTIDSGFQNDFRSMIVKNDGTVVYLANGVIRNSKDNTKLSLETGLSFELNRDDKNHDFSMRPRAGLGYDSKNDIVYLVGDTSDGLTIYDVTDLEAPEMKLCDETHDPIPEFTFSRAYEGYYDGYSCMNVDVLPNGSLLIGCNKWGNGYIVNPNKGFVERTNAYWQYKKMVGTKFVRWEDKDHMVVQDVSGTEVTVSIEGGFPNGATCGSAEYFYGVPNEAGITLLAYDLDGWIVDQILDDDIESLDYKPVPQNISYIRTNGSGTFAILEGDTLRVIFPNPDFEAKK